MIVIDNSRGSLAASDPYQNPAEAQAPWLERMLADARARGIPAIVVGSRELNPNLPPALNVATDAAEEAQIMVAGGASAYLYERPEESRTSQIPSGGAVTIPEFGTGALGYRSAVSDSFTPGQPDALFGTNGYLLVSVEVAKRNPATNVAPVNARLIPLVQEVSLDPVDGTLLRRSAPALFTGLGRRPLAGDRWGPISASSGSPSPPGSDPYAEFPAALCRQSDCSSAIEPEYTFTSSEPEIANFVEQDPNSTNLRKPLQNAEGHPIPDPRSSILCAFNPGTTTVTISAGGLSYSIPVTVQGGSVEQPCGTVPLSPEPFQSRRVLGSCCTHRSATLARTGARTDRAATPTAGGACRGGEGRAQARAEGGAAIGVLADCAVAGGRRGAGRPAAARRFLHGSDPAWRGDRARV